MHLNGESPCASLFEVKEVFGKPSISTEPTVWKIYTKFLRKPFRDLVAEADDAAGIFPVALPDCDPVTSLVWIPNEAVVHFGLLLVYLYPFLHDERTNTSAKIAPFFTLFELPLRKKENSQTLREVLNFFTSAELQRAVEVLKEDAEMYSIPTGIDRINLESLICGVQRFGRHFSYTSALPTNRERQMAELRLKTWRFQEFFSNKYGNRARSFNLPSFLSLDLSDSVRHGLQVHRNELCDALTRSKEQVDNAITLYRKQNTEGYNRVFALWQSAVFAFENERAF
jgi:hypothetical protein